MAEWVSDVRYALRGWRRQPVFAAIAVHLAGGRHRAEHRGVQHRQRHLLQSIRGVPQPDRVAAIGARVTFATFRDLRDGVTHARRRRRVAAGWRPAALPATSCSGAWCQPCPTTIRRARRRPLRGRFFDAAAQRMPVANAEVVVDYEFWRDALGGDPQAIGADHPRSTTLPATIRGIAPQAFHGFGPERPPLWMPLGMLPAVRGTAPRWDDAGESGWRVFGRIADGGSIEQVNAELAALRPASQIVFPPSRCAPRLAASASPAPSPRKNASSSCSSSCCRWWWSG